MKRYTYLIFFIAILTCHSLSQWSADPTQNLIVGYGLNPEICSDSAGGCYITYEQNLGYPRHLILERLNRYGYKPWGNGKQILGELPEQWIAKITEDGRGGVIIAYVDDYDSGFTSGARVRVQRVDSSGNLLWGAGGVRVSVSEANQGYQAVVSDENGGCIVAWVDTAGDLWINRIDNTGMRVWGDSGKYVWNSPQQNPMISDGSGGCYMLYGIGRLQRFDHNGNMYWPSSGILVKSAFQLRVDSLRNVYLLNKNILGYKNSQLLFTLNLQKVDSNGVLQWDSSGVILDTLNTNYYMVYDFALKNGYSWIGWSQFKDSVWDVRTQIVRCDGTKIFPNQGIWVSTVKSQKVFQWMISSTNSSIFVWADSRSALGIYAQAIDTLGERIWKPNDVGIVLQSIGGLVIASDGNGGCILAGFRETDFTIRAQQVSRDGNLGEVITVIREDATKQLPGNFTLYQNYPNPFNPTTSISYSLPSNQWISLKIYAVLGKEIRSLYQGKQTEGKHVILFDGDHLASGIYLFVVRPERSPPQTRKLLLLK
ncbi:MAG: T9SS type A sorting domain-containing protein [Bacteroidota bacterium]|jgi:hypothetical protein